MHSLSRFRLLFTLPIVLLAGVAGAEPGSAEDVDPGRHRAAALEQVVAATAQAITGLERGARRADDPRWRRTMLRSGRWMVQARIALEAGRVGEGLFKASQAVRAVPDADLARFTAAVEALTVVDIAWARGADAPPARLANAQRYLDGARTLLEEGDALGAARAAHDAWQTVASLRPPR